MINIANYFPRQLMASWTIPEDLCKAMVQDFKNRKNHWTKSHSSRGYHLLTNYDMSPSLTQAYETCLDKVIQQYTYYFPFSKEGMSAWARDERYNFQFYEPGSSYSTWHCENNGEPPYQRRHLAFMTYLNTVKDGGQTHFFHQDLTFYPKVGLTLVWPAHFTHVHRGIPAENEEKYITTGWYNFFDTKKLLTSTENLSDSDFYKTVDETLSKVT